MERKVVDRTEDTFDAAVEIASALRAAGFGPVDIAGALVGKNVFPKLTARQLGGVLLEPTVFPDLMSAAFKNALASTEKYDAAEIDAATKAFFRTWTKLGPVGGGSTDYVEPTAFDDLVFAELLDETIGFFWISFSKNLDFIQAVYGAHHPYTQAHGHGGSGGTKQTVSWVPPNRPLLGIFGSYGTWLGSTFIFQIGFRLKNVADVGPFPAAAPEGPSPTPFEITAPPGEWLFALYGLVARPQPGGTARIAELGAYSRRIPVRP